MSFDLALGGGSYSAPTIGSTAIPSGTTVIGLAGLDYINFATNVTPPPAQGIASLGAGDISFYTRGTRSSVLSDNSFNIYGNSAQINIITNTIPTLTFGASSDAIISRQAAANIMLGSSNSGLAAIAQTLSICDAIVDGATSNSAGVTWTLRGSRSTGSGVGGDIVFQTTTTGGSALVQNAAATALTIKGATQTIVLGNAAIATNATDGFLYITTCAGTPTGVPTSFAGRIPLVYDTTNHQFWFYDSGWKQPKTPAAAAIVTWQ